MLVMRIEMMHRNIIVFLVTAESVSMDELKAAGKQPPKSLRSSASDAYLLFQVGWVLLSVGEYVENR